MNSKMILSASGWRKVFAESGNENDTANSIGKLNAALSIFAAKVFSDYIKTITDKENPIIAVGMDTRPTGKEIVSYAIKTFIKEKINVKYTGIIAAPEIMAYSKQLDGFMYISASHNPIGHNGIKFGLNNGGVLNGKENALLVEKYNALCNASVNGDDDSVIENAFSLINGYNEDKFDEIFDEQVAVKKDALNAYSSFLKWTISGFEDPTKQIEIFKSLQTAIKEQKIGVVCDMNGSARSASIDKTFFEENHIKFYAINDKPGNIVHEIIPESENLVYVAEEMERLQKKGFKDAILGYMPDCDGDRGNIVYWDENQKKSIILKAQEVFSLSVLAELCYSNYIGTKNSAVCVNCPTSMRINEIAEKMNAKLFRAEVGEANVVNLAREKRMEGYDVRILGEGSNGGTITYPSSVRDPINTIFAIIKLLSIKEMYEFWCEKNSFFKPDEYTLTDILSTIPKYTTTGVSEKRAILHIASKDHSILKSRFQNVFLNEWESKKELLYQKYSIVSYEAIITNGTKETRNVTDFSSSGKGGLKILFYDENNTPIAFLWMRGSGTEPVFRIMCDVKGDDSEMERTLLAWLTEMLECSDK